MDWTGCREVEQIPGKVGGVPILKGTRVQADAITGNFDAGCTAAEIADVFRLNLEQVQAVLDYASRNNDGPPEEHRKGWYQNSRGGWESPDDEDDEINFTDMPEWTAAQWARAVGGEEETKILDVRWEAGQAAREAFWAAVRPITESDAFKRWFAGSKAVTEEENPKVLYHAAASLNDDFYCSQGPVGAEYGADFGRGFYFFSDPETALTYGSPPSKDTEDCSIMSVPVYLSAVNPLVLRSGKDLAAIWASAGGEDAWFARTPEEKAAYIQRLGFDSVLAHRYGHWVVYQPAQIMVAIEFSAETSPASNSIMTDFLNNTTASR